MAKKLDPAIGAILEKHGFGPEACWDCHGTWVVLHKALEKIAAGEGVVFDPPMVLEADSANKVTSICVTGRLGDRQEWSIGEAAPGNNKNSYPWAMAEKRAKDRVILKLVGLHGIAYSEDEADDFKESRPNEKPPASGQYNKTSAKQKIAELSGMILDDDATPDEETLDLHLESHKPLLDQIERDWPEWIDGIPGNKDFKGFDERVAARREDLRQRAVEGMTPARAMSAG